MAYQEVYGDNKGISYLEKDMWTDEGLAVDIWFVCLGNTFSHPFAFILDPLWFYQWWQRYRVRKHPEQYTQQEANKIYEAMQPEIHEWYANVHRTLVISLFFAPVLPIALVFGSLGRYIYMRESQDGQKSS